jgi:hypothetical protein
LCSSEMCMKPTVLTGLSLATCVVAIVGCGPRATHTAPSPELPLVRADSEVFESVIGWYLRGNGKEYPFKLTVPRVDERPTGQPSGFRSAAGMGRGVAASQDTTVTSEALNSLLDTRKRILARLRVPVGRPFKAPECAGILAPPAAPGSPPSTAHSSCPKESQEYVVVQLPMRGVPKAFNDRKLWQHAVPVDTTGEAWTVITSVAAVGPSGQMWDQHAWVFKRDPANRKLKLVSTLLLAIAE